MEQVELRSEEREVSGKQVKRLRAEQLIPAVVYGPDTPPKSIQIGERALYKALGQAGATQLINLFVGTGPNPTAVLARDIQRDPVTGHLLHVDFYQVRLTEKVKTMPRLEIVGHPPVVEMGSAVMVQAMTEVEVECLPTDLISSIPVDVSGLEGFDDSISIADLPVPSGVRILADPDEVVISVVPTKAYLEAQAEAQAAAEAAALAEEMEMLEGEVEVVEEEAPEEE